MKIAVLFILFSAAAFYSKLHAQDGEKYHAEESEEYYINYSQLLTKDSVNYNDTSLQIAELIALNDRWGVGPLAAPSLKDFQSNIPLYGMSFSPLFQNAYFFLKENSKYHLHPFPSTNMRFLNGSNTLQGVGVQHRQMISPDLSLGWDFRKLSEDGLYSNQLSKLSNNHFYLQLFSRRRYSLNVHYSSNQIERGENGGLYDNNNYSLDSMSTRPLVNTYYTSASSEVSQNVFSILQRYQIWPKVNKKVLSDTAAKDSIKPSDINIGIVHELDRKRFYRKFKHPINAVGSTPFQDSLLAYDSLGFQVLHNRLSILVNSKKTLLQIGVHHELHEQSYKDSLGSDSSSTYGFVNLKLPVKGLVNHLGLQYGLVGYSIGDYRSNYSLGLSSKHKLNPFLQIKMRSIEASWVYKYWYDRQQGLDDLGKEYTLSLFAGIRFFNYLELGFGLVRAKNIHVFDAQTSLIEVPENQFLYARAKLNIQSEKWSYSAMLRVNENVPVFFPFYRGMLDSRLLYKMRLKQKFKLDVGVEGHAIQGLKSYGYIPEIGYFYFKGGSLKPLIYNVNLLAYFQIKRFRVFAKVLQLNQLWTNSSYDYISFYPVHDLRYQIGISWKMFY